MTDRFLSAAHVVDLTSLSRPTIYRRMDAGDFPKPVRLSPRRVGWKEAEVRAWMAQAAEPEPA